MEIQEEIGYLILAILWTLRWDRLFCLAESSLHTDGIAHVWYYVVAVGGDIYVWRVLVYFSVMQCTDGMQYMQNT